MKVSIICPIYNGEKYIKNLFEKIRAQKNITSIEIITPVSGSKDSSLELCKKYADIAYEVKNFNHGKTRHEAAEKAKGDYLVFVTQDIFPYDEYWLYNLLKDLNKEVVAAFSKQIAYPEHGEVEKLIREFNYPDKKRICNMKNAEINGRKNIFYSDASSGIIKTEFFKLGGYDFIVPTNEDVILANNIIESKKSFIYQPESKVWHSHALSRKETFSRYKSIGKFEKCYRNKINFLDTTNEGKNMVMFVISRLFKELKIIYILFFSLDIMIRFYGYRKGKNEYK